MRSGAESLHAFTWSARIERTSDVLPSTWLRPKVRCGPRIGYRQVLTERSLPFGSDLFVDRTNGQSMIDDALTDRPVRTQSAADITMPGVMRGSELRFRSFYLPRRGRSALTVAVQTRADPGVPTHLVAVARFQQRLSRFGPLTVPDILEIGRVEDLQRDGVLDYVVEHMLEGSVIGAEDTRVAAQTVLAALPALWSTHPVRHVRLEVTQRERLRETMPQLVNEGERLSLWPRQVDRIGLWQRIQELIQSDPQVSTGVSHGDLGVGNLLRLRTGTLALIDGEHAGTRLLSHDVLKLLTSASFPPETWVDLHPPLPGASRQAAAPREQLAVATLLFLSGWRIRTMRARKRGGDHANRRRTHALIRALDVLLAPGG